MNKKAEKFLLSLVESNYEEIAEKFNETRKKPMKEMIYRIVKRLGVKEGDTILDLGCGNACFFDVLPRGVKYRGVDNSEGLISYAKNKYGDLFLKKNILDIEKEELRDVKYVFSWAVFHHIPGNRLRLNFLKGLYKNIDDNSYFVFSVWKLRERDDFFLSALKVWFKYFLKGVVLDFGDLVFSWKGSKRKSLRYYHAFSKKSLKKLIKKTKFETVDFLEDKFNYYIILKK
jgi:cyclopropane fatty-acyl-phospholipid synthase-like methyltransferase